MRSALPALLLVAVLVTGGCLGAFGPSRPPSDERALDAVARARAATAEVASYRFSVDGHLEASRRDESVSFDVAGGGAVDVDRRRMNATTRARDATRSVYIAGYTAYTECARMGWGRENLTRSTRWLDYTPLGEQLALLSRTDVYWRGTETVDDTEAAVVVAHPTKRELRSGTDARGTGEAAIGGANVRNATVTVWIGTETGRLLEARREIRISRGGATGTVTTTFRFDYDAPADVAGPPFDEDAVWELGCPGR